MCRYCGAGGRGSEVVSAVLKPGELVLCLPTLGGIPDGILQGWIGYGTPVASKYTELYRHGSWAELASYPSYVKT
jgi:hypothetical protein